MRTRAEAESYVESVCFKHGPPRLLGVELEWTVHHASDPRRPLDPEELSAALGLHAPHSLVPDGPHRCLPNGSTVTVEPGGQVEISSLPAQSMRSLFGAVAADSDHLAQRLRSAGLVLGQQGTDPWRPPARLLRLPRYAAMERAFDRVGHDGRLMMCSTAGVQVCLDAGEQHRVVPRWTAVHALGPVMIAMFGNSPRLLGDRTGWSSTRSRVQLRTDPPRSMPEPITRDPARNWAARALDAPVVCLHRTGEDWSAPPGVSFAEWIDGACGQPPTRDDLDYHLSTMFTPVRPRGYLEVRYLDTQPGQDWMLAAGTVITLFRRESAVDEVLELTRSAAGRWISAARYGLDDPVVAAAARDIAELACRELDAAGDPAGLSGRLADFAACRLGGHVAER